MSDKAITQNIIGTYNFSGSGYSTGRLPQSTAVNNQRFSAADPIDNQVTKHQNTPWIKNCILFSRRRIRTWRRRTLTRFGSVWRRSRLKHFRLWTWLLINLIGHFHPIRQIRFISQLRCFCILDTMKPSVIFWCIFINYYI